MAVDAKRMTEFQENIFYWDLARMVWVDGYGPGVPAKQSLLRR